MFRIGQHLLPLCQPPGCARDSEQHGEHLGLETHGLVDDPGIEIDVGIQLALDEVLVFERNPLQFECDVQLGVAAGYLEYLLGGPLDDLGPRIVVLVNAMSEAHQFAVPIFDLLDVGRHVVLGADFVEHLENFFVGATM